MLVSLDWSGKMDSSGNLNRSGNVDRSRDARRGVGFKAIAYLYCVTLLGVWTHQFFVAQREKTIFVTQHNYRIEDRAKL
jgi:hypothetical protein